MAASRVVSAHAEPADRRRAIPSVDALLRSAAGRKGSTKLGRPLVKQALLAALDEVRAFAERGTEVPADADILARALGEAARSFAGLSEVINATGVVLHTGLGRAPLPARSADAAAAAARGYSDLEVDRASGERGRRTSRAESLLLALTGAQGAFVVNNNAAALLLALAALGQRKEVVVSRGELIEIGGGFRLPDILAASGARLVEVGTTNRTRIADYRRAIGSKTSMILKVHPSNYRVVGFTNAVPLSDLAALGDSAGLPLVFDAGSGLLDRYPEVPADEPAVIEALADGADLVTFSADKLLGGPQAGVIVGRADLVERLRRHPLARALRVDKMTVAALESVLRLYATGRRTEIPLWRMLAPKPTTLPDRPRGLAPAVPNASARQNAATVGSGLPPGHGFAPAELIVPAASAERVASRLRKGRPAVFCRVEGQALVFDLLTVPPEHDDRLARAIRYALEQG